MRSCTLNTTLSIFGWLLLCNATSSLLKSSHIQTLPSFCRHLFLKNHIRFFWNWVSVLQGLCNTTLKWNHFVATREIHLKSSKLQQCYNCFLLGWISFFEMLNWIFLVLIEGPPRTVKTTFFPSPKLKQCTLKAIFSIFAAFIPKCHIRFSCRNNVGAKV